MSNYEENTELELETNPEAETSAEAENVPIEEQREPAETQSAQEAPGASDSEAEALKKQNAELNDKYVRLMAEYDNYRKRSQKERDEIYPTATAAAIARFLPVIDNFERAAEFPHGDDDFGKGFDMIHQSLKDVLAGFGMEAFGSVGEVFDPAAHHAVMHIEDENLGENVVAQVLQKGYKIGDRVIRHAMVQTAN